MSDDVERRLGTDIERADTDGDGYEDGIEFAAGSDPLNPLEHPGGNGDLAFLTPHLWPSSELQPVLRHRVERGANRVSIVRLSERRASYLLTTLNVHQEEAGGCVVEGDSSDTFAHVSAGSEVCWSGRVAINGRTEPGAEWQTLETWLGIHEDDYLVGVRRAMFLVPPVDPCR